MPVPLPAPAPFRPIRRRRYGVCKPRNVVIALLTCLFLATWVNHRSKPVDPYVDDLRDLQGTEKEHGGFLKGLEGDLDTGVRKPQDKVSDPPATPKGRRKAFVVASQKKEDTSWLKEYFPTWERWIYKVDDPRAQLTVPKNKGRESMVYLTFIIDNYHKLPDDILFIHPTRFQWHNDDPDYDGLRMLRHFQLPYLQEEGYVNMRCAWVLGCPAEIKPFEQDGKHQEAVHVGDIYKASFEQLFPGREVPQVVGAPCCAQFGATREKILERPKAQYEKYREWILATPHEDQFSGRVLEYSWHIIFGKEPVHCPKASDCYCKVFGLCNLTCPKEDFCEGRYTLPPYSVLPKGWPEKDWDGKPRVVSPEE